VRTVFRWIIDNPIVVILLVVVAVLAGSAGLLKLPVGLFPNLDVPVVNVITHSAGVSAQDMELLVTRPIEDRIRTIPGVQRVASTSIMGISEVTAQFASGVRLNDARQLVQAEVSSVQSQLPFGVQPRLENIGTTLQEVAEYALSGPGSLVELRRIVQTQIASQLMAVDGVARVEILGGDEPAFMVRLVPGALDRLRLTIGDVTAALAQHNLAVAADFLERGSQEYPIRGSSLLQTVADVRAVPLPVPSGQAVLLGDIASVTEEPAPRHYTASGNGKPAVAVTVSKQLGASTIAVVRDVDRQWTRLTSLLPPGTSVRKFYDQADIISEARDSLFHDLLVGSALAAVVLFLFMGTLRATLITAASIPITLLATVAFMQAFGQTLNVITLSALTLAVGIVVDDAVVVSESIFRRLSLGEDARTAGLMGAVDIAGPDASGTFTTVAVFAPLLFIGGLAGLFVRPFGFVVSVALLASLVFSLVFVPTMFGWVAPPAGRQAPGSWLLTRFNSVLQRVLRFGFAHRGVVISLGVLLLGLGFLAGWLGPVRVLPAVDEGALLIEYIMPPGTSLAESDRIGAFLERAALAQPDIETVFRRTGSPARGLEAEGVNRGELTMKLTPRAVRTRTLDEVMDSLREVYDQIPGVAFLYRQPTQEKMDESLSGLPAVFGVTLFGRDVNDLISLSAQAEEIMARDPGLSNIINNAKIRSPQITVRPDPVKLAQYGLSPADVFDAIRAARFGVPATTILRQSQEVQVFVLSGGDGSPVPSRIPGSEEQSEVSSLKSENERPSADTSHFKLHTSNFSSPMTIESLRQLSVPTHGGQSIPLERVADVEVTHRPSAITHLNGQREITILAEVSGSVSAAVGRLRQSLSALALPPGYSIAFTGQYQVIGRMIRDFLLTGIAAVLLIYFIMAIEFRSWLQPLLILVTIPTALVGAIVFLALTRVGLDVSVGMGVLTLVGISVNNAIVLLAYANREAARGLTMPAALASAASVRLRPILMTALTTVFALVPVAVNPAVGSRIFQPFAVTVIGGLLSATVATLLLLPMLVPQRHSK
jgi:multidrug efflux pump subunit AcrB